MFTFEDLRKFDGTDGRPVYVGAKGLVFDMTTARDKYGPGGPYAVFAGRDASRALGKHSLDRADADNASWKDLSPAEVNALDEWVAMFASKYQQVGTIASH